MSQAKRSAIARLGGIAAHKAGTAHRWNADEAQTAGRKGGRISRGGRGRLAVSDMADAGEALEKL